MFRPKYQITSNILNKLAKIAEIRAIVLHAKILPVREALLRRAAMIKMAHSSTSIEGNTLSEHQVKIISEGKKLEADKRETLEVVNYFKSLDLVDKIADQKFTFTSKDVLRVHKAVISELVDSGKVGIFRSVPVYIVNVHLRGWEEVVYTPPEAKNVPDLINDLLSWLKNSGDIHPIIRAALFHYQFETIHPFIDGNGRTGRLLTLLHLYQSGLGLRRCLVLEDYFNKNRKDYYLGLQTGKSYKSREKADLTGWLEYFVDGFLSEALKVKDQILNLGAVGKNATDQMFLNEDEIKIVDFILTVGHATSGDVVDILNIPLRTAQAKMKHLEDVKILTRKFKGPATTYILRK